MAEIASSIQVTAGAPRMGDLAIERHVQALLALPSDRREDVVVELVALARRLWSTDDEGWDQALMQLALLIALGLRDGGSAVDDDQARTLIGGPRTLRPVGGPGPPGSPRRGGRG